MELKDIIKHLTLICSQTGLTVSPDTILDQAVRIMISQNIEKSKSKGGFTK